MGCNMSKKVKATKKPSYSCDSIGTIGKIIEHRRTSLGLSRQEVANFSNINYRTLDGIEKGNKNSRIENLLNVVKMLGLKMEIKE